MITNTTLLHFIKKGVYSVAAALYDRVNNMDGVSDMVSKVNQIFESSINAPYDDWDSGRSGLLYASPFLSDNLPNYKTNVLGDANAGIISREYMISVAQAVVDRGNDLSDSPGNRRK